MSEDGEKDGKKHGDSDFLLVLAKSDATNKANIKETLTEWAQPKKAMVTTDAVNAPPPLVKPKVVALMVRLKTVVCADQAADSSSPEEQEEAKSVPVKVNLKKSSLTRSYQDLKELFGESDAAKLPSPISNLASSSTSLRSPFTHSTDSVYRSRSLSPHPDLYYFSLIKSGDVTKLKNKFEPRRCNSDSQINQKSQIYIPGQILGGG
ncbi:hypothetical protein MML48_6g00020042 [Holotrichia oblita]|uniref:Uncharacterized protein n=1 Tax=Holotrichia oblita TaxID=644536 RepID=A0ACB9T0E0_HOLOL|nr:hypothetical protein MML48_6g00020042 [Holotrichia oblita]